MKTKKEKKSRSDFIKTLRKYKVQKGQDKEKGIVTSTYENIKKPKVLYSVKPDYTKGVAVREEPEKKGSKKLSPKIDKKELNKLYKTLRKKIVSRKIVRPSKATLTIPEVRPAPYVSRFFKNEFEKEKRNLFLE